MPGTALVVCPRYPFPPTAGGVKRSLRLAECLSRSGWSVTIATDDEPGPEQQEALHARGWDTIVAAPRHPVARRVEQHVRRLPGPRSGQIARTIRADTVALVQLEGIIAASHVTAWGGKPVIYSSHNVEARLADSASAGLDRLSKEGQTARYHAHRVRRTEARVIARAGAVICVSEADAETFSPSAQRVVIAPNGVDDEFFSVGRCQRDREDVLFFGQFSYEPNREGMRRFLDEGWPLLAERRPACRLLIAGEGSERHVQATGPHADRVIVLGLVPALTEALAGACLSLVPVWRGGGTRLKVLESLAARRPVIGTPLGVEGIGFVDGRHGIVADSARDLAAAAASVLGNDESLARMGADGRELAQAFRWDRALAPAAALYGEYLETRADRHLQSSRWRNAPITGPRN